jgi:hypothetical protein
MTRRSPEDHHDYMVRYSITRARRRRDLRDGPSTQAASAQSLKYSGDNPSRTSSTSRAATESGPSNRAGRLPILALRPRVNLGGHRRLCVAKRSQQSEPAYENAVDIARIHHRAADKG